ncbi:hypothetical protein ACER0C_023772 [Sarotherodon galilaeus]
MPHADSEVTQQLANGTGRSADHISGTRQQLESICVPADETHTNRPDSFSSFQLLTADCLLLSQHPPLSHNLHYIHEPPAWQLHLHHPLSNISTLPPLHHLSLTSQTLSCPFDGLIVLTPSEHLSIFSSACCLKIISDVGVERREEVEKLILRAQLQAL